MKRVVNGHNAALSLLLSLLLLCTCSTGNTRSRSDTGEEPPSPSASGAQNQGGENTPSGYTDTRYHYSITGPGPLKPQPDGTAVFVGEDERLQVAVVEGAKAADPLALAHTDLDAIKTSAPNFQVLVQPVAVSLAGQRGAKFTYAFSGKSHTGGQIKIFAVRYYIPKNDSMLAVVSYQDAATEFSAAEADGFANSFHWL
jgi:hypothetical protein